MGSARKDNASGRAARRLARLPLFLTVIALSLAADLYLFALKKLRGSVMFPESY